MPEQSRPNPAFYTSAPPRPRRGMTRGLARLVTRTGGVLLAFSMLVGGGSAAASDALDRAQAETRRGEYAQAEKALAGAPGSEAIEVGLLRARIQLETGRYEQAAKTAAGVAGKSAAAKGRAAPLQAEALRRLGRRAEGIELLEDVRTDPEARAARLLLGELLIETGRRGEAKAPLMSLVQDYNSDAINAKDALGLSMVGRAAHLLRSARDANDAFNEAERAGAKKLIDALLWRSELFLDKYDPGHAGEVIVEASKIAPKNPRVRVAMARVKLESAMDFEAAESEIKQALEVNPKLAGAYFVRAGLALRDMEIAKADRAADAGLSTDAHNLDLLSMKAAIRFLDDDLEGYERFRKQVFDQNAQYSRFYEVVAEFAEWEHRYDDIIRMMKEAVAVDARDPKAHAALGLNLIRAGREEEGLVALQKAWDRDRFNVRVYNTLNLYEKSIATDYVTVDGQIFKIRYHKSEQKILQRYVPQMLAEAWRSMVKRYKFTPKTPVSIELYADTEHFSVRTSGLPNVGIQGVCFGQTLALMSPGAAAFNWGNVLWHELGHVFAIQLSKNHVPRWFTEGLSEYETIVRRTEWQREEDPALYAALQGDRVPPVDGFNRAFTHVDSVEQVTMAYYAASQIVVFMVGEFGFDKVVRMMPLWGEGKRTPEVIKTALGISSDELDRRFRAWLEPRFSRYRKQYVPDRYVPPLDEARDAARKDSKNAKLHVALAVALMRDGQVPEGKATLEHALELDPKQPDAHYVLLQLAMSEEDLTEAQRIVGKMVKDGNDGYAIRMRAADLAEAREDVEGMKEGLEMAARLDPSQAEPLQGLVDLEGARKNGRGELEALERLSKLDQHDRRVWRRLLSGLVARGMWERARQVGESAVFVDVKNPEVHRLYARALARTGKHRAAIREYNSAIITGADEKILPEIYRELAKGYEKLGHAKHAKKAKAYQKRVSR